MSNIEGQMGRKKGSLNRSGPVVSNMVRCFFRLRPEVHDKFEELHQWFRDNRNDGRFLSREAAMEMIISDLYRLKIGNKRQE